MLAHALDIVSHALVRGSCALRLFLAELLHHSEMCFLGRRLERSRMAVRWRALLARL